MFLAMATTKASFLSRASSVDRGIKARRHRRDSKKAQTTKRRGASDRAFEIRRQAIEKLPQRYARRRDQRSLERHGTQSTQDPQEATAFLRPLGVLGSRTARRINREIQSRKPACSLKTVFLRDD
jgi:hypothetical protein